MNLDEIVEYQQTALREIGINENVVGLILNNPSIDMDSDEADSVFSKYLFDYEYVDSTTQEAAAFVWVEADVSSVPKSTIKWLNLYVTVSCHKEYMKLNPSVFKGMSGNRRDNLCRFIESVIGGSGLFGIGDLKFTGATCVSAPPRFTARVMTFRSPDFVYEA